MDIQLPFDLKYHTPYGTFDTAVEVSVLAGVKSDAITKRCLNPRYPDYSLERIIHTSELTCTNCSTTHPLNSEFFRVIKTSKGVYRYRRECRFCAISSSTRLKNLAEENNKPSLYRFIDEQGIIVYIGKSRNLRHRINCHTTTSKIFKDFIGTIECTFLNSFSDMHVMEQYLIGKYKPIYNKLDKECDTLSFILPEPDFKVYRRLPDDKRK